MHTRFTLALALVFTGSLLLTGCSSGSSYALLDGEQTAADALPAGPLESMKAADPATSRLAATEGEVSFWLAHGTSDEEICILIHRNDQDWTGACGGAPIQTESAFGKFTVQPDGHVPPEGTTKISENIYRHCTSTECQSKEG